MVIVLPKERNKLTQVEKKLNDWFMPPLSEKQLVDIHLPKFTIESNFNLIETLKRLGMIDAFESQNADFSGINEDVFISTVAHRALVEVNEKGTEAAAGTGVAGADRGIGPKQKEFRADHPFIFWIKENSSNTVLFLGRVVEPKTILKAE